MKIWNMEYGNYTSLVTNPVFEGNFSQKIDGGGFSKEIWIPFNATTTHYYAYLKVSCYVYIPSKIDSILNINLCAEMLHNGKSYFWRSLNFEKLSIERNKWVRIEFVYLTPEVRSKNDVFKTYLWNRENTEIYIDKLQLESFH